MTSPLFESVTRLLSRANETTPPMFGPRLNEAARDDAESPPRPRPPGPTILVVDDDPDVRTATRQTLESYGYDVVEAADGVDAIGAFKERSGRISLVVTDVVMWRMGGGELCTCLAYLYPGTRVLFMSGYEEDTLRRQGLLPTGGAFVAKPFEPDALAWRVRKLVGDA
jgi:two-component system cell cycle sensor histidine kinase/response regulator CckA